MQTEIEKSYSQEQIEAERQRLREKYESIENLNQKFSMQKCGNPDYVDDYMVWKALEDEDVRITERVVLKNLDIYQMISPKRMEIVDYLSSNYTDSIKALATRLNRNYKNVYDDIKALNKYGLVELLDDGKNKLPFTRIQRITVVPEKKTA